MEAYPKQMQANTTTNNYPAHTTDSYSNSAPVTNRSDCSESISSNGNLDEDTADFFDNLNKLATFGQTPLFSMPSVYQQGGTTTQTTKSTTNSHEDLPFISPSPSTATVKSSNVLSESSDSENLPFISASISSTTTTAKSSGFFSGSSSAVSLEANSSKQKSSLLIVDNDKEDTIAGDGGNNSTSTDAVEKNMDECEIETIQLPIQNRKKNLLIEVSVSRFVSFFMWINLGEFHGF